MRRLNFIILVFFITITTLVTAMGDKDKTETQGDNSADATITLGSIYPPVNLNNVGGAGQGITEALYRNVYESLLNLEDNGDISNGLAESYTVSADNLVYTFKLQNGVKFHDGSAFTATDVKYSFERVVTDESKAARKADMLLVLDSIEIVDDLTIIIHLKQPSQSFPYFVTYVWMHDTEAKNIEAIANGTGPYRVADYKTGTSLSIERQDGYWGPAPKNKKIIILYFSNDSALTNALLSGQVDLITNIGSPEQAKLFKERDGFTVTEGTSTVKQVLAFNDKRPPFTDMRVRQAISSAINKEAIRKATWDTFGMLIGTFVSPSDPWYEDLSSINSYDQDRAKKLLTEAGYADGFSFELITPSSEAHQLSAQAIKSDLAKIGVTVSIKVIDPSAWYQIVFKNRDYDATLQEHVNDRDLIWYGNPNFYWGYDNKEVQKWVAEAQAAMSPAEQTKIYMKIARKIAEEAASSWLYLYPQLRVSASNVTGYPVNGKNSMFYMANIQKK